jgi:steroid delta-isomerase-like uncharacterized protein
MTATTTEPNTELIDRIWDEVVERGEMDVVDETVTNEYVLHTPGAPEPIQGPEGLKQYKRTLRAGFPDLSVSIEDRVVGEEAVVDRYRMQGTHDGEFMGIPPTGVEVEFTGIIIHYLEDDTIVKNVAEFNVLDLMQQLGVVEPPGE